MSQTERQRRLRLLIKRLNKERKRQASKVDILCNDLIGAQREFVRRLDHIGFVARFYKGLLGAADLRGLLGHACRLISEELPGTRVVLFLRQTEGGEGRLYDDAEPMAGSEDPKLEGCLTSSLTASICKCNRLCTMEDLLGMGLEGRHEELRRFSAATVPLNDLGRSLGFLLLSRAAQHPLGGDELEKVALVTCGLSQAIQGFGVPLHSRQ
ncbi:MAG: hypothetical protein JW955_23670 [Sedimentisphaerales bacterium]|nr:hypothetical protein [Sedimentisphaerales bacterium]